MTLQAGVAIRDISPRESMFLAGYPDVERRSAGVHDPLLATALCLRNREQVLLIVSLDILLMDPLTARKLSRQIAGQTGIAEECIFVSCTHTHSGPLTSRFRAFGSDPDVNENYMREFMAAIVDAAIAAAGSCSEAELAWTTADAAGVGGNRHALDGVSDPEVGVLVVRDAQTHKSMSLSMIHCMHPTVMHEDSLLASADFPGYTRVHLRNALGMDDLPVLFHMGPSGNQSPRYHVKAQTFDEAERLGRMLGGRVLESVQGLRAEDFTRDPVLRGTLKRVRLPLREFPGLEAAEKKLADCVREFERLQKEGAPHGPVRTAECAVFGARNAVAKSRAQESGELAKVHAVYNPAPVQVLRIGCAWLVGLPGEMFVEYDLQIKEQAGAKCFVVSLVNGDLQGYVVTPEAEAAGGYEANGSMFMSGAGEILVRAAVEEISCEQ